MKVLATNSEISPSLRDWVARTQIPCVLALDTFLPYPLPPAGVAKSTLVTLRNIFKAYEPLNFRDIPVFLYERLLQHEQAMEVFVDVQWSDPTQQGLFAEKLRQVAFMMRNTQILRKFLMLFFDFMADSEQKV